MNGICLICGKKLNNTFVCECGYDETKYYDRYKTLDNIGADIVSSFRQRTIFMQQFIKKCESEVNTDSVDASMEIMVRPEITVGSSFVFGSRHNFCQGKDTQNSNEPNTWTVLNRQGNQVLLLSDSSAGRMKYNVSSDSSWEFSTLRRWLNNDFVMTFAEDEQKAIVTTQLQNHGNAKFGEGWASDTYDKIFVLSQEEIDKYIPDREQRILQNDGNIQNWWLRTAGWKKGSVMNVDGFGNISDVGKNVDDNILVRPAMWLDLSSLYSENDASKKDETPDIGTIISFGNDLYEHEWVVLDKQGTEGLVVNTNVVKRGAYNDERKPVTWEYSSLRKWLNGEYYEKAFSVKEKNAILEHLIKNGENAAYHIPGGRQTQDKIFLLSIDEYLAYGKSNENNFKKAFDNMVINMCWLRSPGFSSESAAIIDLGKIGMHYGRMSDALERMGQYVNKAIIGVKPAMWVDLTKL